MPQSCVRAEMARWEALVIPPSSSSRLCYRGHRLPGRAGREGGAVSRARVAIIMGSQSDWGAMRAAEETLEKLGIPSEVRIISAHRTPERLSAFIREAETSGIELIIAGAGSAAHLAGVTAAQTLLPVLGVPLEGSPLGGLDALLARRRGHQGGRLDMRFGK